MIKIKVHSKPLGIPDGTVAVSGGDDGRGGPHQVTVFVGALDQGITSMACSLRLSPDEARRIAADLVKAVEDGERRDADDKYARLVRLQQQCEHPSLDLDTGTCGRCGKQLEES